MNPEESRNSARSPVINSWAHENEIGSGTSYRICGICADKDICRLKNASNCRLYLIMGTPSGIPFYFSILKWVINWNGWNVRLCSTYCGCLKIRKVGPGSIS